MCICACVPVLQQAFHSGDDILNKVLQFLQLSTVGAFCVELAEFQGVFGNIISLEMCYGMGVLTTLIKFARGSTRITDPVLRRNLCLYLGTELGLVVCFLAPSQIVFATTGDSAVRLQIVLAYLVCRKIILMLPFCHCRVCGTCDPLGLRRQAGRLWNFRFARLLALFCSALP